MVLPSTSRLAFVTPILLLVTLSACGSSGDDAAPPALPSAVAERLGDLDDAVSRWASAPDLTTARAAAETARNLVTGPGVAGYGDADGDGTVGGAVEAGLLPDEQGRAGLVPVSTSSCVERDVLGGSWADPAGRWEVFREHLQDWRPDNNTFPDLPSLPQRVVGWASLALGATDVAEALEYAGHAGLHVRVSQQAVNGC